MALEAMWAALRSEVSGVSQVQAPAYAGLLDTPADFHEVSRVLGKDVSGPDIAVTRRLVTPDIQAGNLGYLPKPAWLLGCTPDTSVTPGEIKTAVRSSVEQLSGGQAPAELDEPKRIFGRRGSCLTDKEQAMARAYNAHHFNCGTCIAAGQKRKLVRRCSVGQLLWNDYLADSN